MTNKNELIAGTMHTITVKGRPAVYRATSCFSYGQPVITLDLRTYDNVPAMETFGGLVGELYGVNDTHALYKVRAYRCAQTDAFWGVLDRATGQKTKTTSRPAGMRFDRVKHELDTI